MRPIRTFTIIPAIPERLQCLKEIAYNLSWSWDHDTLELFRRLDRDLWEEVYHNPVDMLGSINQETLESAAKDDAFIAHMNRVYENLKDYMESKTWYEKSYGEDSNTYVAYFSAEFGITECLPIYSGGLGVLAGDHLKSASDLGLPLVGIGLLYQHGYFTQYLNSDGWQQALYPSNDFYNMPVELMKDDKGNPITITIDYPTGPVKAHIWRIQVGRVSLYLLDTNIPENQRLEDRNITNQLYVSGEEIRIRQEIMLGIGGVRALKALNIDPIVFHMNEGHSAFLAIERICLLMKNHGLSFTDAKEVARATNIFTTHTPVPAGIDVFSPQLMDKYFRDYCSCLDISFDNFLDLGRLRPGNANEGFSMPIMAMRLASYSNGVSQLHGKVARRMWNSIWPEVPEDEVPIGAIVNGVHIRSWVSKGMSDLFDRYLGPKWAEDPLDPGLWEKVKQIPADELWRTHERRRERLVAFVRRQLLKQLERRGALSSEINKASEILNPEALTIGFARRFASYKRATLILKDPQRLEKILCNKEKPVQLIFAGKAHPDDGPGKELIRQIIHITRQGDLRKYIVFIEDYDINVARYLVQGCDLWLSTPRRLSEASSTSGMKAAANGGINMSVLDGWWDEAYKPEIGWAIGHGENYSDEAYQDKVESEAIYEMLEKEVVPLFYNVGNNSLPRKWIQLMKASMASICPMFNTNRMVHEYIEQFYHPSAYNAKILTADNFAKAKEQSKWKTFIKLNWSSVRIDNVDMENVSEIKVGNQVKVKAQVYLGVLNPEDVDVEIYKGTVDSQGEITNASIISMNCSESHGEDRYTFEGNIKCDSSGLHGYTVRILPRHGELSNPHELGLILWSP
ncbi:alpha-glucan family phosphorylase [Candidatus Poribacteria bacterium]|nr:alpha-glucan family phosphorylase [Candidatus Poribacteria bacterium]